MGNSDSDTDLPVFLDKTGKRWQTTLIVVFAIATCIVAFLVSAIPSIVATKPVVAFQNTPPATMPSYETSPNLTIDPVSLGSHLSQKNVPVIGAGSLVRVISIKKSGDNHFAIDPFSGKTIAEIDKKEVAYINGDAYAIMRYGETSGRRIVLTFDDGPHPEYTPPILDLLSKHSIAASFFVTGDNVVKYPEIAQRMVREGHIIANHTFSHINFDTASLFQGTQEINQTARVITAATGQQSSYFRVPYGGSTDQSLRNSITGILTAQQLGYTATSYNFDSSDWKHTDSGHISMPAFDGKDKIILLHDGGGNREHTVAYVEKLISQAKMNGYTFANLDDLYPQSPALMSAATPTLEDTLTFSAAWTLLVMPKNIVTGLFFFSLVSLALVTSINVLLAVIYRFKSRRKKMNPDFRPFVSVVVPAYNEGPVIKKTVRSLLASNYKDMEIIIIDDGSTDDTWPIAQSLASDYQNVVALHQENRGKAGALNNAIRHSRGSIIISVDADTIFPPDTVPNLVRHFHDPKIGAVAGVVRVGNVRGMLTLWQALEYAISISIERNAHAQLGTIMIVPGACGAWRKTALMEVGGLSSSTLAEDCDLTLTIQQLGKYTVIQDNEAVSYTEAPQDIATLTKQRFRWTFGSIQSLIRHRRMIFNERYGILGMFIMPYAVISILIPLIFWPVLTFIAVNNIMAGNYLVIVIFFAATMTLQFLLAFIGLLLSGAPLRYIIAVPFARFVYGPIRVYILYRTVVTALKGSYVGWNKFTRTGTVEYTPLQSPAIIKEQAAP